MESLYGADRCHWFKGEHRLNDKIVNGVILPLVRKMLSEKE